MKEFPDALRGEPPEVKKKLWGDKFWTSGYYVNTMGQYGNPEVIKACVKNQGKGYKEIH